MVRLEHECGRALLDKLRSSLTLLGDIVESGLNTHLGPEQAATWTMTQRPGHHLSPHIVLDTFLSTVGIESSL